MQTLYIPEKVLTRPSDRPWFTSELRYYIRIRDRLRRKALKSNNVRDITRYKAQRNRVNNMKKYAKETYMNNYEDDAKETYMNNYEDMILNQNCGGKTFWQLMGRLVGKQSKICATPPLQTPDDSYSLIQKNPIYSMTIFALFLR